MVAWSNPDPSSRVETSWWVSGVPAASMVRRTAIRAPVLRSPTFLIRSLSALTAGCREVDELATEQSVNQLQQGCNVQAHTVGRPGAVSAGGAPGSRAGGPGRPAPPP